ncbi:unnamed protein product [Mytilus edulis]|uniref:Uncharacterized protein n=1 Tax=Mytilus edulis TaxID=6550 RepID=A0A8S3V6Q3_MYTED|nr:unnamed protein product [Mytilus edulis]
MVRLLVRNGAQVNLRGRFTMNIPIMFTSNKQELISLFLEYDSNQTELHNAVRNNDLESLKLNIQSENIDCKTKSGWTVLHYAVLLNNLDALKVLFYKVLPQRNATLDVEQSTRNQTFVDIIQEDPGEVSNRGPTPQISIGDNNGLTAIHLAVINNNIEIITLLLRNNAKINIRDDFNRTPLHYIKSESATKLLLTFSSRNHNLKINRDTEGCGALKTMCYNCTLQTSFRYILRDFVNMPDSEATAAEEKDMPIDLLQIKTHFIPHPEENIFFRSRLLQRLFILSSIFHTQNNACTQPLHMLITDTADKFSNSSTDFLAILSRFGICVSKDTHKRFLSDVVEQNNTTESTPFKSFAIGSYDNIDKNQVHSSVTAGKSNSGFHGTSVQIVEPLPETLLHSVTNSSSENSILETTDPLTTLLNSSSTSEMSTSSSEILTLSSEILTSSEFFTSSNVIPTSSSVISTSNTEISTKCIQQGENTNSISSSCDSSPVKNDILDTIPNLDNSHYKKYSETSHIRSSKRNMSSELLKNLVS